MWQHKSPTMNGYARKRDESKYKLQTLHVGPYEKERQREWDRVYINGNEWLRNDEDDKVIDVFTNLLNNIFFQASNLTRALCICIRKRTQLLPYV